MSNAFVKKLNGLGELSEEDKRLLENACSPVRNVHAGRDLASEGDPPGLDFVILDGWACRYKLLPDGTRQITAFLMPGDSCDMHASVVHRMEHSVATVTPARVAMVSGAQMAELLTMSPTLTRALWWAQIVEEDTLRAWIVNMGRRNSIERVAHLMCELFVRARNIGLIEDGQFELPLTQAVLGDALGLTAVHVNRVLRKLRIAGVLELKSGTLTVADIAKLARVAGFDDGYLQRRNRRNAPTESASRMRGLA